MNKIKQLLAVGLLAFSAIASANVTKEMFQMNRELGALLRADSVEQFQTSAEKLIEASKKAQATMPASLEDDQEKFPGYQKGMQEVIDVVEQARQLANQGKLDEAKTTIEQLNKLKKMYHAEYK